MAAFSQLPLNMGLTDRRLRVALGVVLLAAGLLIPTWWGLLGLIPLITGLVGFCPIYRAFGLSTRRA